MTAPASGPLVDRLRAPEWPGIVPAMSTMHEAADTIERLERQALPYSDSLNKYHAAIRELLALLDDRDSEIARLRAERGV